MDLKPDFQVLGVVPPMQVMAIIIRIGQEVRPPLADAHPVEYGHAGVNVPATHQQIDIPAGPHGGIAINIHG